MAYDCFDCFHENSPCGIMAIKKEPIRMLGLTFRPYNILLIIIIIIIIILTVGQ